MAVLVNTVAACMLMASHYYSVPLPILQAVHAVEGGKVGQQVGPNNNGTYDLGPMQINTLWLPMLAEHWGTSRQQAKRWVRDDACTNTHVAAWILKKNHLDSGNWYQAIKRYHSATPGIGDRYARKVIRILDQRGQINWGDRVGQRNLLLAQR